jgi:hypothetical protein
MHQLTVASEPEPEQLELPLFRPCTHKLHAGLRPITAPEGPRARSESSQIRTCDRILSGKSLLQIREMIIRSFAFLADVIFGPAPH